MFLGCGEGDRQDEAGRCDAGADAAGGPAHEARPAPTRGKRRNTGQGLEVVPRLREGFRQVEAEVVSDSGNKIHQTWDHFLGPPLYTLKCA